MGFYDKNTLILLYTYESDLGDGWEDQEVHNDPQTMRRKALEMGANIVKYAFEKSL
jgi:DhnA family fructose-bisphosphate aldolase class Ia